ncbi:MAG TPA: HAMP domain-containing sensor histidine kinase [Gemmatimonadaceae bacterium]|nr:HAMP domain-containing sensor histidine kinase [Gemmatimonadaceae bacterium]
MPIRLPRSLGLAPSAAPLAAALALIALATTMLGYWAWQASLRRHEVAVALLRSQADLAAQRLSSRVEAQFYVGAVALFRPLSAGRFPSSGTLSDDPAAIFASAAEVERCRCAPVLHPAYAFRTDLTTEGTVFAGATRPSAAARAWLLPALRLQLSHMTPGADVAVVGEAEPGTGRLVVIMRGRPAPGQPPVVFGVGVDSQVVRRVVFGPPMRDTPLLGDGGGLLAPNDSLVAVRVIDRAGNVIFRTAAVPDPAYVGTRSRAVPWGMFRFEVAVRPRAASYFLAGGMPRSPLPMLLALIGVAALLLAAAGALVWRMMELARLRGDFTSSVSHELRTPLTQILLYAEMMQMGRHAPGADPMRPVRVIKREAHRLLHLVENVLQFSRAERRLATVELGVHALAPIVAEVVRDFEPIAATRGAVVSFEPADASLAGRVDPAALRRILINYLDNAVRYGPPGQTVVVGLGRRHDLARVWVHDQGPGVPAADRERVWKPFVRLGAAADDAGAGCGIGLAIVRELTRLQGGRCGIEEASGGGARFYLDLSAAEPPAPVAAAPDEWRLPEDPGVGAGRR